MMMFIDCGLMMMFIDFPLQNDRFHCFLMMSFIDVPFQNDELHFFNDDFHRCSYFLKNDFHRFLF